MRRMKPWRGWVIMLKDGSIEGNGRGVPSLHVDTGMLELGEAERYVRVEVHEVPTKPRKRLRK